MKRAMALGEYYYNAFVAVYDSVSEQIYVPVDVLNRAAIFKACNCNYTTAAEMAGEEKTKFWRQLKKDIKKYPNTYNAKNN
jgi:RNAse (barnase) inhibitor barstar